MVVSASYSPELIISSKSFWSDRRRFGPEEALFCMKRCVSMKQLKQIHVRLIRSGLENDQLLVRKMIELCSDYGELDYARMVFEQVLEPATFTWNMMIRVYNVGGRSWDALVLFNAMICGGVPDKFTFPFVVKACIGCLSVEKGKEVHGMAVKMGLYQDMFLRNTLLDLYLKCGDLSYAHKMFDEMRVRNVVSWTTMVAGLVEFGELESSREVFEEMPERNVVAWSVMINGYARNRFPQDAFELLRRMQLENVRPNEFTLVGLLRAATDMESLKLGRWIHDLALKNGFRIGVFLGTALIDMYSKCDSLDDAKRVFEMMDKKSVATWNTMLTSLGVHGHCEQALDLYSELEKTTVLPDAITFVAVLSACINTRNIREGYRLFKRLAGHYGITPIQEHYDRMVELRKWAKMSENMLTEEKETITSYFHLNGVTCWESVSDSGRLGEPSDSSIKQTVSFTWDAG